MKLISLNMLEKCNGGDAIVALTCNFSSDLYITECSKKVCITLSDANDTYLLEHNGGSYLLTYDPKDPKCDVAKITSCYHKSYEVNRYESTGIASGITKYEFIL